MQPSATPSRDEVRAIISDAICELNDELDYDHLRNVTDSTPIFDGDESLDSLSLVSLIVDIEARVEDTFATEVVLASEKAMSMQNSPYRSVQSLIDFVLEEMAHGPESEIEPETEPEPLDSSANGAA